MTPTSNSFIFPFSTSCGCCASDGGNSGFFRYSTKHLTKSLLNSSVFCGVDEWIQGRVEKNQKQSHRIDLLIQCVSYGSQQEPDLIWSPAYEKRKTDSDHCGYNVHLRLVRCRLLGYSVVVLVTVKHLHLTSDHCQDVPITVDEQQQRQKELPDQDDYSYACC